MSLTPTILTATRPETLSVVVIGAGGTGARVLPGLVKILKPQMDRVHVVDFDTVEHKNLLRQHFCSSDVGRPKAEVMSERYSAEGLPVIAHLAKLSREEPELLTHILTRSFETIEAATPVTADRQPPPASGHRWGALVVSCVDTREARRAIGEQLTTARTRLSGPLAWIDVGNETRSGQALLSLSGWPVVDSLTWRVKGHVRIPGYRAMPQIFQGVEDGGDGCLAIDTQTMAANNMAACAVLNMVSWVLHGVPFASAGTIFSVMNAMTAIPLRAGEPVLGSTSLLHQPSDQFSVPGLEALPEYL